MFSKAKKVELTVVLLLWHYMLVSFFFLLKTYSYLHHVLRTVHNVQRSQMEQHAPEKAGKNP
jgi:hypothetical protein